jgi:hypothetical protein
MFSAFHIPSFDYINLMSRFLSENLVLAQLVTFPSWWNINCRFWKATHRTLTWSRLIQSYFFKIHFRAFSHLRLVLPSSLFPSSLPTKILCAFFICPVRSTCLAYILLFNFIPLKIFSERSSLWSSSVCGCSANPDKYNPMKCVHSEINHIFAK